MDKNFDIAEGAVFYTATRGTKKIVPVRVTKVEGTDKDNIRITLKAKSANPTMFNCDGTFSVNELMDMVGVSLFFEPVHVAIYIDKIKDDRFYNLTAEVMNDIKPNDSSERLLLTPDKMELINFVNSMNPELIQTPADLKYLMDMYDAVMTEDAEKLKKAMLGYDKANGCK